MIFLLITMLLNGLFYYYLLNPAISWFFGSDGGFIASLGQWSSGGLLTLTNSSYVTVRDLTVSGTGAGTMVLLEGGHHNTVGGCTFKNSAATAVGYAGGHSNRIVSNDLYDVANHLGAVAAQYLGGTWSSVTSPHTIH